MKHNDGEISGKSPECKTWVCGVIYVCSIVGERVGNHATTRYKLDEKSA